jgi:NADPH-dependent curcumin reductase CurA
MVRAIGLLLVFLSVGLLIFSGTGVDSWVLTNGIKQYHTFVGVSVLVSGAVGAVGSMLLMYR